MKKYTNKVLIIGISTAIFIIIVLTMSISYIENSARTAASYILEDGTKKGNQVTYANFDAIKIKGPGSYKISQGDFKVNVSGIDGTEYYIHQIEHTLVLKTTNSATMITIQMPELKAISTAGKTSINISGFTNKSQVKNKNEFFNVNVSGATNLDVTDSSFSNISLVSSGASTVSFKNCTLKSMLLDVSGASNLNLNSFVNGSLTGSVTGFANLSYSGKLLNNNLHTSGAVNINPNN